MIDVKGKWALITGASRGIGRLAALFMAGRGCNLILQARDAAHCAAVLEEARRLGVEACALSAELSDPAEVDKLCREVDALGVPVDIILNNAGLQIAYRSDYLATPASDFDVSFRVCTTAPMMICYHFLPGMKARGFGRIVNTTSGIDGEPEQAGYSAAKAALNKVTRDLGRDLAGTNVMVNLTDPGWCRTDLGGPKAPNAPESALPGVLLGVFLDDGKSGRIFAAQDYAGMTLEEAVSAVEGPILVTAFEPFGGDKVNPTQMVLERLPEEIGGRRIEKLLLPVEFVRSRELACAAYDRVRPAAVVMLGLAGTRGEITPETTGRNLMKARIPDNAGYEPQDLPITEEGPAELPSTFPIDRIIAAVGRAGVPCRISHSAGLYVCNNLLYAMLAHDGGAVPTGFIHVPAVPELGHPDMPSMEFDMIYAGICAALGAVAESIE